MNTIKYLAVAALLAAATSSAFASELDGKSDNAWLAQTTVSQQAPAPTASATQASSNVTQSAARADTSARQDSRDDYLMP